MTAEGSVYQRKDGRWVAQYQDLKGKTRYLYRMTKTEARKALREALKDRDDGYVVTGSMKPSSSIKRATSESELSQAANTEPSVSVSGELLSHDSEYWYVIDGLSGNKDGKPHAMHIRLIPVTEASEVRLYPPERLQGCKWCWFPRHTCEIDENSSTPR